MVNNLFMTSLAKLESVAATDSEKETINAIRGRYVAKFGADHAYVDALNKLEAVAATEAEKAEINKIRGKFGLFEMTSSLTKQNPDLLDYADDELYNEGDTGSSYNDPDDQPMSEEERLSKKYGTPMSIVGEEIVRNLDPDVRDAEDREDLENSIDNDNESLHEDIYNKKKDEYDRDIARVIKLVSTSEGQQNLYDNFINELLAKLLDESEYDDGKDSHNLILDLYNELDADDFKDCISNGFKHKIHPVPITITQKLPATVHNKPMINRKQFTIYIPSISLTKYGEIFIPSIAAPLSYNGNIYRVDFPLKECNGIKDPQFDLTWSLSSETLSDILLSSDYFVSYVEKKIKTLKQTRGEGLDIDGVYGTMAPEDKTPEDAYSDFDEAHQPDTIDDPYNKYR